MLNKLLLLLFTSLMTLFSENSQAAQDNQNIAEFCKENFPAVNVKQLQSKLSGLNPDRYCTLESHEGSQVPVQVKDLLNSYAAIQRNQNRDAVTSFQQKMRKKVAQGIAESRRPYEGLYGLRSCEQTRRARSGSLVTIDSSCVEEQNFEPKCNDPKINNVLNDEKKEYLNQQTQHVDQVLKEAAQLAGVPITHPEASNPSIREETQREIKKAKKFSFLKRNIETALMAKALVAEKEIIIKNESSELAKLPRSSGQGGGCTSSTRRSSEACKKRLEVKQRYEKLESERQFQLARMYEKYPTAFDLDNNAGLFDWFNYQLTPSKFAQELDKKLLSQHPKLKSMSRPEHVRNFLDSDDGMALINSFTEKLITQPNSLIEKLGREATFSQLRKKRETIEHICASDGSDLHHFTGMAQQVLAESANNSQNFVKDQSAYCYLVQTSPLDEGGFTTGQLLGAGGLIVGGFLLQIIPTVGNVAGAAMIVKAGGIVLGLAGGGVFSADAIDRYQASAQQDENTQSVYHAANSWVSAEELIASKDNRYTQAAFAAGEVALTVVDAALFVRPAVLVATKLYSKVPKSNKALSSAAPSLDDVTTDVATNSVPAPINKTRMSSESVSGAKRTQNPVVTRSRNNSFDPQVFIDFSNLPSAQRAAKADEIIAKIRAERGFSDDLENYMLAFMQRADLSFTAMTPKESKLALDILDAGPAARTKAKELLEAYKNAKGAAYNQNVANNIEKFIEEIFSPMGTDLAIPSRQVANVASQPSSAQSLRLSAASDGPTGASPPSLSLTGTSNKSPVAGRNNARRVAQVVAATALVTAGVTTFKTRSETTSSTSGEVEDSLPSDGVGEAQDILEISVEFKTGDPKVLEIEVGAKDTSFEVQAKVSSGNLPADGKWVVTCSSSGSSDLCESRSGFVKDSPSQKLNLFKNEPYSLVFQYTTADPKYRSLSFTVPLERVCSDIELGPGVDRCEEVDKAQREPSESTIELDEDEGFWWEGLEPNQPPPPVVPGPPLRLRSFMLPGYI